MKSYSRNNDVKKHMAEPIHYTNRKGKTYYLRAATTKKGKTRYVMTRTAEGALTKLPAGHIITESVNGQVSVGRTQPRLITDSEEALVQSELEKLGLNRYRCDVKGLYIIVYEPLHRESDYSEMLEEMGFFALGMKKYISERIDKGPFDPVMRFRIYDQEKRMFGAERMTYRGHGGWRELLKHGTLKELIRMYLKHLGKESFYELM